MKGRGLDRPDVVHVARSLPFHAVPGLLLHAPAAFAFAFSACSAAEKRGGRLRCRLAWGGAGVWPTGHQGHGRPDRLNILRRRRRPELGADVVGLVCSFLGDGGLPSMAPYGMKRAFVVGSGEPGASQAGRRQLSGPHGHE